MLSSIIPIPPSIVIIIITHNTDTDDNNWLSSPFATAYLFIYLRSCIYYIVRIRFVLFGEMYIDILMMLFFLLPPAFVHVAFYSIVNNNDAYRLLVP